MSPEREPDLQGAAKRATAAPAGRRGVRDAVRSLADEALRGGPHTPARILDVARAIRAGIASASGIKESGAHAAASEALAGLEEALSREFVKLQDCVIASGSPPAELAGMLEDAEALRGEFGAHSQPLSAFVERLRRMIGAAPN